MSEILLAHYEIYDAKRKIKSKTLYDTICFDFDAVGIIMKTHHITYFKIIV